MFAAEHFIIDINTITITDSTSSSTIDGSKREHILSSRNRWWILGSMRLKKGMRRSSGAVVGSMNTNEKRGANGQEIPTIAGTWMEVSSGSLLFFFLWSGNPTTRGYNWKLFTSIEIDFISIFFQDRDCVHHLIKFDFFNGLFLFDWRNILIQLALHSHKLDFVSKKSKLVFIFLNR